MRTTNEILHKNIETLKQQLEEKEETIKKLYKDYYKAIQKEDFETRDKAFSSLKLLKQEVDAIKEMKKDLNPNVSESKDLIEEIKIKCRGKVI